MGGNTNNNGHGNHSGKGKEATTSEPPLSSAPASASAGGNFGRRRQQQIHSRNLATIMDLPSIDTSVGRANLGGSVSMPPSPTMDRMAPQSAPIRRYPSNPHNADLLRQRLAPLTPLVQGGKMTKVPHYGRLRSVTARILRMIDPRTLAQQHQRQQWQKAEERAAGGHPDDTTAATRGTAAGVLGLSFVDTVRDAAAVRRRRRYSHGSIPMGTLSRHASSESPRLLSATISGGGQKSVELTHPSWLSRPLSFDRRRSGSMHLLSPVHSSHRQSAMMMMARASVSADERSTISVHRDSTDAAAAVPAQIIQNAVLVESIIAIPMPGYFLDPESDHWVGGHSFQQRMRYPNEAITVPASLTKRVHYEVSYDYPKNVISTARYNVVTFMPAQLVAQFSKVANLYFLFIAILQQVPGWSTTGQWSTILPLCVFVSLSIAHEGFDDLRRHRMDRAENTQHTRVLKVKVHDRQRLSFNFRELRHRGSQSIHSFRMRSSRSIHDIGHNTVESARRWAESTVGIGSTIKESIVSRIAAKRRKQRELEDSDDEDEHLNANQSGSSSRLPDGANAAADGADPGSTAAAGGTVAESILRRRLNRGVLSVRSWRSGRGASTTADASQGDSGDEGEEEAQQHIRAHRRQMSRLGGTGASFAATASMLDDQTTTQLPRRTGPTVAFNDVVEEMSYANGYVDADLDEQVVNPLPENMSCRWKRKRWENVQVGDLLMITKDEWIPADCIVIASTGFDGTCFVETAALDGETTLKQKQALEVTNSEIQTPEQLAAFNAFTYVEPESAELYNFEGYMERNGERYPLTPNQLLLRGSVLRNTAYVFAQAVYCGEHTRLRLNATRNVRTKAPQIQRITNRIVILVFLLLLVLCFVFSALGIHWNDSTSHKHWYLQGKEMSKAALIFGYIVMMNALIPISLYVTLEAVKIFQCWFIQQDVSMYHADTNTRAEARTTAINEDLGMVRYVFSDKTGTLTENIMKLRAVMVSGFSYLHIDLDRLQEASKAKDGLAEPLMGGDADVSPLGTGDDAFLDGPTPSSPRVHKTSSRLSFLRPGSSGNGPLSAGANNSSNNGDLSGRQSPSLFRTQLLSKHRRQHSLPSPAHSPVIPGQGPRVLQQLAAANRMNNSSNNNGSNNNGSSGLRHSFAKHVRGMSASVLRQQTGSVALEDDGGNGEMGDQRFALPPDEHRTAAAMEEGDGAKADNGIAEPDPDLVVGVDGDDPRMHTKASEDAPVSDLLALPSSRRMMDSYSPPSEIFRTRAEWFLRCMALCHTVQPDRDPLTGRITGYQATSPDEKALVAAAAELGYVMNNRAGPLVQLRVVASERMRDFNRVVVEGLKSPGKDTTKRITTPPPVAQPPMLGTPGTVASTANSSYGNNGWDSEKQSPFGTLADEEGTTFAKDTVAIASASASAAVGEGEGGKRPGTASDTEQKTEAAEDADADADAQSFDRGVPPPHPTDALGNYEVLDVLEFSSARKRMSVIMRCPDGRVVMMSKGADSAILARLIKPEKLESSPDDASYLPAPAPPPPPSPSPPFSLQPTRQMTGGTNNNINNSTGSGSVFGTLPGIPPPHPHSLSIRRKMSQPNPAYLQQHSRTSSVASNNMPTAPAAAAAAGDSQASAQTPGADLVLSSLPPRFSESFMIHGGESSSSPRMPSGLCTTTSFGVDDEDDDEEEEDEKDEKGERIGKQSIYGTLPSTPPTNSGSGFRHNHHHQKKLSGVSQLKTAHRRLMSDSQFSAISEVSSFADALGHVEVPDSFESPSREEEEWARARALEALHQFSTEGLRTLVYAHKEIDPAVYEAWHQRYVAATTALANRQQQVEALCEEIEGDLLLSGVSAIEDRLQNGVPETIFKLRRAGIRVWMLTGDKVETAINIAKSCRLIDTDVVETTSVDVNTTTTAENKNGEKEKEKMLLLVMQSITDHDELDKIISNALEAARNMAANSSIDDRFEKRTRREKLRRGMKKFGNMLDPRRLRHRHRRTSSGSVTSDNNGGNGRTKDADGANGAHVEQLVVANVEQQRPATAIEWASDVAEAPIAEAAAAEAARASSLESAASETTRGVSKKSSENGNNSSSNGNSGTPGGSLAVVIDGETLAALEQHEGSGLLDKFLSLGTLCDAVICSRVSPSQKALIVHNMRVRCEGGSGSKKSSDDSSSSSTKPGAGYSAVLSTVLGAGRRCAEAVVQLFRHDSDKFMVTLAIGDGGNDIAMIQEAHVGIGIAGQEGLQASRSADFSIGQFRFLQKLLLVHGRWSYVRVSMFIMATFYKCMAFYVMQLIFQFYTGFSGTSLFESWTLSMYNTLFSILPVLVVGIFEQDLQPATLMAYPELYRDMGPRNHLFTVPIFIRRVVVIGIVHSIIAAYFPFASNMTLTRDGVSNDQYLWSISLYGIMVMIVTLKIAYVDVRRWVYFSHVSVILSLAMWFLWNGVLCHVYPASPGEGFYVLGSFTMLLDKGPFWFQWIIFVAIALCLNVLVMLVYTMRDPVEHRITTWVAFERRNEHARHRAQRKAWLRRRGLANVWELLSLKHLWAGR
ncbi:hypothetical protein IWW48_003733 [Coemansia sp. RSA 1200]|nr:hypothetical protein IWW48_003733 [Coemansia sp. RSA 1200]